MTAESVVVSVTDDETAGVRVSPTELTLTEGNSATYTVVVTTEPAGDVTVTVNDPTDNSAVTADPASLTFTTLNWDTAQTVTATAAVDTDSDGDTATVPHTVSSTDDAGYSGPAASNVAVTVEDPTPVAVSFEHASYQVGEGSGVDVKVQLNADPGRTVIIPLTKAEQGGATTADYSGDPASVTFNSGDTEREFTLTATSDSDNDDGESVKLTFGTLPNGVAEGTTKETIVSITDDDVPAVTVSYGASSYTVAEGASVTVTVTLSADPERTVEVPTTTVHLDGARSADLSGVPEKVPFASRETEKTFDFAATQDEEDDDGERVSLTFGTLPDGVTTGTPAETTVSITDDDVPAVTVTCEQATYSVNEGSTVTVKLKLSQAPERSVTVPLTISEQGGASSDDYSGVPESLSFGATDTEKVFIFTAAQDDLNDDGESVKLTLGTLTDQVSGGTTNETTVPSPTTTSHRSRSRSIRRRTQWPRAPASLSRWNYRLTHSRRSQYRWSRPTKAPSSPQTTAASPRTQCSRQETLRIPSVSLPPQTRSTTTGRA